MLVDFKDEDFDDIKGHAQVHFFRMQTLEDLKRAIDELEADCINKDLNKGSLYIFDEATRYCSPKKAIGENKKANEELVKILDLILSTWRSTQRQVCFGIQRVQADELGINLANFQTKISTLESTWY